MDFINASGTIGVILASGTAGITGNVAASLFMILFILMALCMVFSIPLEFLSVLLLPFCIVSAAFYGNFIIPVIIIAIYVSSLIAKNWLFR